MSDYLDVNRALWDERAPAHAGSPGYGLDRFVDDPSHLSDVIRFDLPRLGEVSGLRGVHLQCHIGTDTLSLARLGASMVGVDFSAASLAEARRLAERAGPPVEYVESDVYEADAALDGRRFDLVFTGIGALGWLPDVGRWADVVAALLEPGGRLFLREGHPVLWTLDERVTDRLEVAFPYFHRDEPMVWEAEGTYVETDVPFTQTTSHEWNHPISDVVTALLTAGFEVTDLAEHDSVPWEALPGQMVEDDRGEWHLTDRPDRLPLTYTLQARHR